MTPSQARWARVAELFDAALERPDQERSGWLAEACTGDPSLREEVESLLAAHASSGPLDRLPTPPDHPARPIPALRARLEHALAAQYELGGVLGRGGMATVFQARERKHDRQVVLKVLKEDVAAAYGAERFLREVRIAARLTHPHILGLIDSGEADGLLYYVMPYLPGEMLDARLRRDGPLPAADAAVLLCDIADALAHAHRGGVVHRDLKPGNVLAVGGHAFLLDFGIAKLLDPLTGAAEALTGTGGAIGTPAYMAPEQLAGDPAMDHRVDLYAWGVLAYELLTGERPLGRSEPPGAPKPLARLVADCLAPDPRDRVPDAETIVARLRPLLRDASGAHGAHGARGGHGAGRRRAVTALGLAAAGAAIGAALLLPRDPSGATPDDGAAAAASRGVPGPVAVAALRNETGDTALAAWGRMAGDWITQGLQETGLVPVVPWPSALRASEIGARAEARGEAVDPVALLREETGAGTVVTGAYYLVGDSLRFRVEVTDAAAGRVLGTLPPVSAPRRDPEAAVALLRERLMGTVAIWRDERFGRVPGFRLRPPTYASYQAFDRGLRLFVDQGYAAAVPEFLAAHALDTTFAVPLAYAATAAWNDDDYARADSLVHLLRGRTSPLGEYHRHWLATLAARLEGDGQGALAAARRAAASAPAGQAGYNVAHLALEVDRPAEALTMLERLDPDRGELRSWSSYWTQLTHALHLLGHHERELVAARTLRTRFPERRVGIVLEARALAALGRIGALDTLAAGTADLAPSTYWSQGAAEVVAGEELLAHGRRIDGRARLERGAAWLSARLAERGDTAARAAHHYWLGSALYNLGRPADALPHFRALVRHQPERLDYRGLLALAEARLGRGDPDARLADAEPRSRGGALAFRARLAAVRGDTAAALALFADAAGAGVSGLPWLHASAHADLAELGAAGVGLPISLGGTHP
jgi:serine/threonine protein kinase/tetratricopeptide (TPR) repeat protein